MSDDDFGAARNVHPEHPSRSLFQVGNPFWPPAKYERIPSHDPSSIQALRCRDEHSPLHSDSFIVDIPLGESNSNSSGCSTSDTTRSSSFKHSSLNSDDCQVTSPRDKAGDSSNNSSPYKELVDTTSDNETPTDDPSSDENRNSSFSSVDDSGDESGSQFLSRNSDDVRTLSDSSSLASSSDYEQYASQRNRNVNALKRGKSESPSSADSKPLVNKKGESGDDSKSKNAEGDEKSKKKGKKGSRKNKPESDSENEESGSEKRKSRSDSKGSSKDRKRSKGGRSSSKKKGKGDKDKKKKNKKGSKKKKSKKDAKKGQFNQFFNVFARDSPYPTSVYFILGSEFCERFTYYGLRSILVMYLTGFLGLARNDATAIFHLFSCMAYFSPIIGASVADGLLGRYKTILYLSCVYAVGCIILAATALPPRELSGPLVGLFLISIGTGGIKPCVVTFGGDQFPRKQIRRRATFFSTFYFMINIGSVLSTFITPVLRSDVRCVDDSCYPLAFGVPAGLMTLALIVFYAGHNTYQHVEPSGSLLMKTVRCICTGKTAGDKKGKEVSRSRSDSGHDKSSDEFDDLFVHDVKMITRLLWLFIPLPVFWALFNQQGSRWTLQAAQLDGTVGLLGRLKPDQMQALNPLFIILLIPVFERVIYPCINSCGIPNRPLQRMVAGMMFSAFAFGLAAFLQIKIDSGMEPPLQGGQSGYTIMNTLNCKISVRGNPIPFFEGNIPPYGETEYQIVKSGTVYVSISCPTTGQQATTVANLTDRNSSRLVVITEMGRMNMLVLRDKREKSMNGTGYVSFLHLLAWVEAAKIRVSSVRGEVEPVIMTVGLENATFFHIFEPGSYQVAFPAITNGTPEHKNMGGWQNVGKPFEVGSGGVYTVALIDPAVVIDLTDVLVETYVDVKENSLSMMLMIPQYVVLTVGEILFSISGLAFAYTQAPETMKSMIQACWLLTTSVGDLIVIFVSEIKLAPNQAAEFIFYGALMFADAILFSVLTCFYTYVNPNDLNPKKKKKGKKKGKWKGKKKKGSKSAKKKGSKRDKDSKDGKDKRKGGGDGDDDKKGKKKEGGKDDEKGKKGKRNEDGKKGKGKEKGEDSDDDTKGKRKSGRGSSKKGKKIIIAGERRDTADQLTKTEEIRRSVDMDRETGS